MPSNTHMPSRVSETDINSRFELRDQFSSSTGVIIEANLREDGVDRDFFEVFGLPAGAFLEVEVVDENLNTVLGRFDAHGNVIEIDDNSGKGLLSRLTSIVPNDGVVNLAVSGFADFDFDGRDDDSGHPHGESGDYQLLVHPTILPTVTETDINSHFRFREPISAPQGVIIEANLRADGVDRDFFEVFGLPAGAFFEAEVVDNGLDTVLGRFDAHGNVIETDDNSGQGSLSLLSGIVPDDGVLNLAVSGYPDFDSDGRDDRSGHPHGEAGNYNLALTFSKAPPMPQSFVLYGVESHTDSLSIIDPDTGGETIVGRLDPNGDVDPNTSPNRFATPVAMVIDPEDGTIFVWNNSSCLQPAGRPCAFSSSTRGELVTVDAATGAATPVNPSAPSQGINGSLAFNDEGRLYVLGDNISEIDPETGLIESSSRLFDNNAERIRISGADFRDDDVLFGLGGGFPFDAFHELYTVDPDTGAATLIGTLNMGGVDTETGFPQSLVFAPDGTLLASTSGLGLFELDPATAEISNLRPEGSGGQGLGFVPRPSPTNAVALGDEELANLIEDNMLDLASDDFTL